MVVFTCNNCGDSVTKPKVDKHIQYECKRKHFAVSFCCVDCLKDFNRETVRDHCQCVTEDQRYSAKGYVPKPSAEKGKRKQAGWVDIVQSVMNKKDLPNEQRQFLNIVAKFDNVPRKKNKFQNFCFSTAPAYRKKGYIVDQVFDMIEAEYKAQLPQNSNGKHVDNKLENSEENDSLQDKSQEVEKKTNIENDEITKNCNGENETEETPKKKKSKKSLEAETQSEGNIEPQSGKKKKRLENNLSTKKELIVKDMDATEAQTGSTKKSKKQKNITENVDDNNPIQEPQEIKKKKKSIVTEIIDNLNGYNGSDETPKKKKKSKQSLDAVNNDITTTQSEENIVIDKNKELNNSNTVEAQSSSAKKNKKNINKSELEVINDISNTENVCKENGKTLVESGIFQDKKEPPMSKKEKKELKKKMKYQHELLAVTNDLIEEEPITKKKKRKLNNNEENEEPQKKILKTDSPKVPDVQSGRKFEWNEAISQVLQSKKNKPMSLSKVMKRVMSEFHFLNKANKSESDLEKIFLKKIRKMKNVMIENDKVKLVEC